MFETDKLTRQKQDPAIWEGLEQFANLPGWLAAARNPALIKERLEELTYELATRQLSLDSVDIGHLRYKNDVWTGQYDLYLSDPGDEGAGQRVIPLLGAIYPPESMARRQASAQGELGHAGWRAVLPELGLELKTREPEKVLAALDEMTDPRRSRDFLASTIRAAGDPRFCDLQIWASNPRVMRYKPGSRCTVVYDLEYEPDLARGHDWPALVVAKTYRGEKGLNAFESMAALMSSPLGTSRTVKIAEPLAYHPEKRILIQGPIFEEMTLKQLLIQATRTGDPHTGEQARHFLRRTGVGLAELHLSNVRLGRIWQWKDEMGEIREWVERLSKSLPELARAAEPFVNRLDELEAAIPPDPLVPAHGSFRPAQVLIHQGEMGFIDFDSFCQSEPANDLGLFLAAVMSIGLTTPVVEDDDSTIPTDEATRQARFDLANDFYETLLQAYERQIPVSRQRVALWTAMDIFMLVLHGWTKIKVAELDSVFAALERFIRQHKIVEAG